MLYITKVKEKKLGNLIFQPLFLKNTVKGAVSFENMSRKEMIDIAWEQINSSKNANLVLHVGLCFCLLVLGFLNLQSNIA